MELMSTPTSAEIHQAAAILRRGGLVAFPTETVYGLGADADNAEAVRSIFAAKGRPADHPVIVHLANAEDMHDWSYEIPKQALRLAECYWPGPLTMILRSNGRALDVVTGGLKTVGLRVPGHPVALELLRAFGGPIAAPSANRFGRVSATRAEHVREEFGAAVEMILDGGECEVGLESTIVDFSGNEPAILRPGAITLEQVEAVCGQYLAAPSSDSPQCSGRLASHYAPAARVEIVAPAELLPRAEALLREGSRVAILRPAAARPVAGAVEIPLPADLNALAHELYAALREVDRLGCNVALVTLPADAGLGAAIADRLLKAAGPR